jgi:hypothetical protein
MSQGDNQIFIQGRDLENVSVKSENFIADVTKDYCLIELGNYTFKLKPEQYRSLEVVLELAKTIRMDAGIYD